MGKIIFVFVLAFVAIQGIQSAFINKHASNVMNDSEKGLRQIIQKGDTHSLLTGLFKKAGVLNGKANDPLYAVYQIRILAVKTKTEIAEVIAQNNIFLVKECGEAADKETLTMEENSRIAVNQALDLLYIAFKPFEADFLAITEKVAAVNAKIADVAARCEKEFPNNLEGYHKCVDDRLESEGINAEIEAVQKLYDELSAAMQEPLNQAGEIYDRSMDDLYLETSKQAEIIVYRHLLSCYEIHP